MTVGLRIVGALCALSLLLLVAPAGTASMAPGAEDRAAIQRMLDARSRAVMERDEEAFMATVAPDADEFVAEQSRLFRQMGGVPFGSYHLTVRWDRYGDLVTPAVEATYPAATDVAIPVTEERYRLAGFDANAANEDMFYTFVKENGRWLIAADTDVSNLALYSARHLWDFGPIKTERSGNFLFLEHSCRRCPEAPPGAAGLAEASVRRVDGIWTEPWPHKIAILVPRSGHELQRMLQATFDVGNFVAFAYSTVSTRRGLRFGGHRILLNPGAFEGRSSADTEDILTHELLHVATRPHSGPFSPVWVEEGFAEYVGERSTVSAFAYLADQVASGLVPARLPTDLDFTTGDSTSIYLAYVRAHSAVTYFIEQWGLDSFIRFYLSVGRTDIAAGTARYHIDRAFRTTIGMNARSFEERWASSITGS